MSKVTLNIEFVGAAASRSKVGLIQGQKLSKQFTKHVYFPLFWSLLHISKIKTEQPLRRSGVNGAPSDC